MFICSQCFYCCANCFVSLHQMVFLFGKFLFDPSAVVLLISQYFSGKLQIEFYLFMFCENNFFLGSFGGDHQDCSSVEISISEALPTTLTSSPPAASSARLASVCSEYSLHKITAIYSLL